MRFVFICAIGILALLGWGYLWPVKVATLKPLDVVSEKDLLLDTSFADDLLLSQLQPLAYYLPILEAPLFEPSRQERLPAELTDDADIDGLSLLTGPELDVWIAGRVVSGRTEKVLIKTIDGLDAPGVWLAEGESFEGGKILEIKSSSVIMTLNGEETVLPIGRNDDPEGVFP